MMNKKTLIASVFVSLAMNGALVMAGDGQGRFMRHFDTNNDGRVHLEEFNAAAADRFKRMDADANGVIDKDEFRAYVRARKDERRQRKFARIDSDANGVVERSEFLAYKQAKAERKFTRMDKNADGIISKEEYASCKKRKHHKKRMFKRMDKDGDGKITQDESMTVWSNWFKRIDANHDQVVTTDEVKAFRNKLHGKNHGNK